MPKGLAISRGWLALLLTLAMIAAVTALIQLRRTPDPALAASSPAAPPTRIEGGPGGEALSGSAGPDQIVGRAGDDRIAGLGGADILRGGRGADALDGGEGDDWIAGDRDDDVLSGGGGADSFHFAAEAGSDRVLDFDGATGDRVLLAPGTSYVARQEGVDTVIEIAGGRIVLVGVDFLALPGGWIGEG